jgi:stress responsive alpha/beta barrel protein
MLTHVVVWKYRADVELFAREEHVKLLRALEAYTVHPEHVKVAEFGRSISAHVASVDFVS